MAPLSRVGVLLREVPQRNIFADFFGFTAAWCVQYLCLLCFVMRFAPGSIIWTATPTLKRGDGEGCISAFCHPNWVVGLGRATRWSVSERSPKIRVLGKNSSLPQRFWGIPPKYVFWVKIPPKIKLPPLAKRWGGKVGNLGQAKTQWKAVYFSWHDRHLAGFQNFSWIYFSQTFKEGVWCP